MATMLHRQPTIKNRYSVNYHARLGRGGFGDVYLGRDTSSNNDVAIKLVEPTDKNPFDPEKLNRELRIMRLTDHPNLVRLLDDQIIDNTAYIVLELCSKNLNKFAKDEPEGLPRPLKWQFIREIVSAIDYLHAESYMHRDLKPENILVKIEGDVKTVKVSDFGLSKKVDGQSSLTNTAGVGTPFWMAPEIVTDPDSPKRQTHYGISSDCFAVGMNIYAIVKHCPGQPLTTIKGPDGQAYGLYILRLLSNGQAVPEPNLGLPEDWMVLQPLLLGLLQPTSENRWKIGQAKTTIEGIMPHIQQRLARWGGFHGHYIAGVSERGHVAMADLEDRHISLLHGPQCRTAARFKRPDGVGYSCRKAVDASGRVLVQAKGGADTICMDREGRVINRSKSSGWLLTCMGDGKLCYAELRAGTRGSLWRRLKERRAGTDNDYRIRLQRGGDGTPTYLEPPGRWEGGLSVCRNNDGTYWVTESGTRSLDIFTAAGDHIRHEDLPYRPTGLNAIAATSSGHVLIAELGTAAIHIHDASGRRVGGFTEQQMQVEKESIYGISYCREGDTLTVLAGDGLIILSVQTFRIEYKY